MRYSPYDMADYGLQHQAGSVTPLMLVPYDEATWNLYWASIPQLEPYLSLQYEDFDGYRALTTDFPFVRGVQARAMVQVFPPFRECLAEGTPSEAAAVLASRWDLVHAAVGAESQVWIETVLARLGLAQSLFDVKEAAALCRSVVAVDFRAGRRL